MILREPFKISSRLLPGLKIGGAWVQLEYSERPGREHRTRYRWTIDLPDGSSHSDDDLQSGNNSDSGLQSGFGSLLSFLGACGESIRYSDATGRKGENADLFPGPVAEWAATETDELAMLGLEIEGCEEYPYRTLIEENS